MLLLNNIDTKYISVLSVTIVNSTVGKIVKRLWGKIYRKQINKKVFFFFQIKTCVERGGFIQNKLFVGKGVRFTKPSYAKMYLKYYLKIVGDC